MRNSILIEKRVSIGDKHLHLDQPALETRGSRCATPDIQNLGRNLNPGARLLCLTQSSQAKDGNSEHAISYSLITLACGTKLP